MDGRGKTGEQKQREGNRSPLIFIVLSTLILAFVASAMLGTLWTGTHVFTATEQLVITSAAYDNSNKILTIKAKNTGASPITLSSLTIKPGIGSIPEGKIVIDGGETYTSRGISVNGGEGVTIVIQDLALKTGTNYDILFLTSRGNTFVYTLMA
ncbi:MAG: hypothetical protein ACE5GD_01535 [Candidatus Geothermarchaeales archaeon]